MDTLDADAAKEQLAVGQEEGEEWGRSGDVTQDHLLEALNLVSFWDRGEYSGRSRQDDLRSFFEHPDKEGYDINAEFGPCEFFREGFIRGVAVVGNEHRNAELAIVMSEISEAINRPQTKPGPKKGKK